MNWALQGVPQWIQQLGGPVGAIVGAVVVTLVIWKRRELLAWWRRRGIAFQRVILSAVAVLVLIIVGTGLYVWDYVQHDNNFCNSCHVMGDPFQRFQQSEHSELNCHDCHSQSLYASARQLHLWVANRPEDIGPHAPVSTEVCSSCHVVDDPDSTWQRISATAGHRVHLESDSSALADVQCVTCHGSEVHRFRPASETCGESGCHEPANTRIVLGAMAGQTGFHCVTCHDFTAPADEDAPADTARMALVPALEQCSSCHEMEKLLVGLDPEIDPHKAVCGTCHNPHTQELPSAAATQCVECHADADTLTPFHRGLRTEVVENCVGCHEAHTFVVEGDDCVACHADLVSGMPTARRAAVMTAVLGRAPIVRPAAFHPSVLSPSRTIQDPGFDHRDHRELRCAECHTSQRTHGEVTLASRAQCLDCHHSRQVAATGSGCARCHAQGELSEARTVEVAMSIRGATSDRRIAFDHDDHLAVGCAACHTQGAALRVERTCASCHENHHTAKADCTSCHRVDARASHTRDVHARSCAGSGCHESALYGSMTQGRNTCLACHVDMRDHRPDRACAACHRVSFAAGTAMTAPAGRR